MQTAEDAAIPNKNYFIDSLWLQTTERCVNELSPQSFII